MMEEIMLYFASKVRELRLLGVNDIILDPGFGFSKTVDQELPFDESFTGVRRVRSSPLVGISRKSMIYRFLGGTPADSLNGTTVLNALP